MHSRAKRLCAHRNGMKHLTCARKKRDCHADGPQRHQKTAMAGLGAAPAALAPAFLAAAGWPG